jgi:hypothetical protein
MGSPDLSTAGQTTGVANEYRFLKQQVIPGRYDLSIRHGTLDELIAFFNIFFHGNQGLWIYKSSVGIS